MVDFNNVFHPSNGVRCLYLRDRRGNPVGLIMSENRDGQSRMGWSLCKRKEDVFRKFDAKVVAFERMTPIPTVMLDSVRLTPMNCALTALSQDASVPHTVSSGARRELNRRRELESVSSSSPGQTILLPCYP